MARSKTAGQWFEEYGKSHQNAINKAIHWVAVPSIYLSIIGLLWSIPTPAAVSGLPFVNWAVLAVALVSVFYLRLSVPLALGMLLFSLACLLLVNNYSQAGHWPVWQMSLMIFIVMWIFQFIGHRIEGKKPSFFQDIQFLLIGPAWLLHFVYKKLGVSY